MAVRQLDPKKSKKSPICAPRETIGGMLVVGLRPGVRKAA